MTANGLQLGFGLPVSGSWATPDTVAHVAHRADELGYASLWTFQRLLVPAGADVAPVYHSVQDPLIALAYAAALTTRVRLGIGIVNVPFYAPIVLAKSLTSLDVLSGGRLDAGLGLGWSPAEFAAAGVPFERRGARAEEAIRCLQAIWGDDPVQFDGEFFHVPAAEINPKPIQRPHPPLLLGGMADPALRRIGRVADGWISSSREDLTRIGRVVDVIKTAAVEAGRDPDRLRFVVRGLVDLGSEQRTDAGERRRLTGTADQIRDDLAALAEQGITEVFFDLNFDPRVGTPGADPHDSVRRADQVLDTFAPAAS
ncbi:MAG: TIGR03619 family F420-dependent LLM class oxidoreductase [Actinomycetota bacterium]